MPTEVFVDIVKAVIPTILALTLGWIGGAWTRRKEKHSDELRRIEAKQDANNKATRCLVRKAIIDGYDLFVVHQAPMTVERRHEYTELYEAYKELNGNGVVDHLFDELINQPTVIINKEDENGD